MSEFKHTPGPWFVSYAHDGGIEMAIDDEPGMQGERNYDLATVRHGDPDELLANARLIAAAPELLEALRITRSNVASLGPAGALDQVWPAYREWLAMIDGAIEKATGSKP